MKNLTIIKVAIVIALSVCSCSRGVKPRYETIDNEWFSCELVSNWKKPTVIADGELFQDNRLWHRNSPDYNGDYAISINFYDDLAHTITARYKRDTEIEFKIEGDTYHYVMQLNSADGSKSRSMVESWGFIKGNDLVEICYQYPKDGAEEVRNSYRRIVDVTLNSLKLK